MALDGVSVLDLSRVLAGPWCTQTLADLGADVIKVERPARDGGPGGDDTRGWGPPFLRDRTGAETAEAAYYVGTNRNKRSVTIDIATDDGAELVRTLADKADIFVENFKVGDLARRGLDAATLLRRNPRLVYCSITGFGQTGPYRERAGYDYAVQGMGGLMSVTGPARAEIADDASGGGPQKVGVAVADLFTGMYAVTAILAALRHRDRTGQGQAIDMALLDTQVAMLANLGAGYLASGIAPQRAGNAHQSIVPYQVFEVADGHLILAVGNDAQFARFCAVAGCAELAADARFARNAGRVRHRDTLVPLLAARLKLRPRAFWLADLEAAKVPCGPINDLAEVFADPQVRERAMTVEMPHPLAGSVRMVASPIKLAATPVSYRRAPPLLGADTDAVLAELGLDAAAITGLRERGAI
jgi:crotonobetainyl-CoA:carnitine CoA-transferase CaiB-like acyl-CoA transferase